MKNIIFFLAAFFATTTLTTAQAVEVKYDSKFNVKKQEIAELSQEQINDKNINDWILLANQIGTQQIAIDELKNQLAAEANDLRDKSTAIEGSLQKTKRYIKSLEKYLTAKTTKQQESLDHTRGDLEALKNSVEQSEILLQQLQQGLENKIESNERVTSDRLSKINTSLSKNTRNWIIAVSSIALLSAILFSLLRIKLNREKCTLSNEIIKTQKYLEGESVKLDNKLVTLLETQLKLRQEEQAANNKSAEEVDHSLALKVADEIIRIQKNLTNMDPATKGLKQLNAAVKRIQDNFDAKGYELVEMIGKRFDEGMKVSANFRPDESLNPGEQIITRIIKPQVNYNGVMIQSAQIEVSINE
ncbi:hypothetical protein ACFL43_02305 [Thermodesulfobacteriota bacterium]